MQELLAEGRNASDRIQKLDGDIAHLRKSILLELVGASPPNSGSLLNATA